VGTATCGLQRCGHWYVQATAVWALLLAGYSCVGTGTVRAGYSGVGTGTVRTGYSGVGAATCGLQRCGHCYVRATAAWALVRAGYSGVGTGTCGLDKLHET
jgi:hypothetical protein